MIETLIVSLILAAISGVTFVAYKHPNGYRTIAKPLISITIVLCFFLVIWNLAGLTTNIRILKKNLDTNSDAKISESSYLIESMNQNLNSIIKAFIVVISLDGYLMFLWFLHPILGLQKEKKHVSEDT